MSESKCKTCDYNNGVLSLNKVAGISCKRKREFIEHPEEVLECDSYEKAFRRKAFVVTDNDLYNAATSWLLDTDADSFADVIGPIFGVKIELKEDNVRMGGDVLFKCTPIKGQYMDGLEDIAIEEDTNG